jgi:hypothetical protein
MCSSENSITDCLCWMKQHPKNIPAEFGTHLRSSWNAWPCESCYDHTTQRHITSSFLTSSIDGGVTRFVPRRFTSGEAVFGTHHIQEWVGLRVGFDAMKYIKISAPAGIGTPIVLLTASHYNDCAVCLVKVKANCCACASRRGWEGMEV